MTDTRATYRVQLHEGFTFDDVASIAPYLKALGISHVYLSPILQAMPGSLHGYDVIDHSKLNEDLGGRLAYERMTAALEENELGQIVDIVPNHMATGRGNKLWWDVLKNGKDSSAAQFFDIDWDAPQPDLKGRVLVPILGNDLDECLERGEITFAEESGEPVIQYFEHVFPTAPGNMSRDLLEPNVEALLERQHYLLSHWKRAARHLNYRRFFDINELAGLETDRPDVFSTTHDLVLGLVEEGNVDGLRVDHIDGLRDPLGYLTTLRERAPHAYIVVEKILEPGEQLPAEWPIEGTTGYDFLNLVQGVLVDPAAEDVMTRTYTSFTNESPDLAALTREKKMLIMRRVMASDLARLARAFVAVLEEEGSTENRELAVDETRVALAEIIASLNVYRTYVLPDGTA
ncbi:MAG: malto-oligosyltrehalose synthase, partial [Actinobacteria bacterium]|nr:malto-oligosyltrehalose synthase [Actinomycetota bacterium]